MERALARLALKMAVAGKVYVPAHEKVVDGERVHVDGYWRESFVRKGTKRTVMVEGFVPREGATRTKTVVETNFASREMLQHARIVARRKIAAVKKPTSEELEQYQAAKARAKRVGGEFRGNAKQRERSRKRLLEEFGNGAKAPCVYCGVNLSNETLSRDKILPGELGGRYNHENLLPACGHCNKTRQATPIEQVMKAWRV